MQRTRTAGVVLLVAQLAWFVHEQGGPSRYFCWAPLHEHVWYRIDARLHGAPLGGAQISARYGRANAFHDRARGERWELNAAQHVLDSVSLRERSLPSAERATVTVTYRVDDREPRTWTFTP